MTLFSYHKVDPDLADPGVAGDHPEVTGAGHIVVAGVVRVDQVDELLLALVAAAVDRRHNLPGPPLPPPGPLVMVTERIGDIEDE